METEKKPSGALVGLIVIIIILIIGGLYIWKSNTMKAQQEKEKAEVMARQDALALDALEKDLATTDTNVTTDTNSVQ